jgi:hypothetical protein
MMKVHHAHPRRRMNSRKHLHYPFNAEPYGRREKLAHAALAVGVVSFGLLELYVIVTIFSQLLTNL